MQHRVPHVPVVLHVPVGGRSETCDQQAGQFGGVRGVHRLQGQVVRVAVRAQVFRRRREQRGHVPAIAGAPPIPDDAAEVRDVLLAVADRDHREEHWRAVEPTALLPGNGNDEAGAVPRVPGQVQSATDPA